MELKILPMWATNVGHKSICCKSKKWRRNKKYVNKVNTLGEVDKQKENISNLSNKILLKRKLVFVTINNIKIKLQLDTGSNITIINQKTSKKLGKLNLLTSRKVTHGVSGRKLNFFGKFACNISFMGKIKKAVVLVLKNTTNLFGMDSIALFDLWDLPINLFFNQVNLVTTSNITELEKFKTGLKRKFPEVFFLKVLGHVQKQRQNLKLKKMQH